MRRKKPPPLCIAWREHGLCRKGLTCEFLHPDKWVPRCTGCSICEGSKILVTPATEEVLSCARKVLAPTTPPINDDVMAPTTPRRKRELKSQLSSEKEPETRVVDGAPQVVLHKMLAQHTLPSESGKSPSDCNNPKPLALHSSPNDQFAPSTSSETVQLTSISQTSWRDLEVRLVSRRSRSRTPPYNRQAASEIPPTVVERKLHHSIVVHEDPDASLCDEVPERVLSESAHPSRHLVATTKHRNRWSDHLSREESRKRRR